MLTFNPTAKLLGLLLSGLLVSHSAAAATGEPTPSAPEAEQALFDAANRSLRELSHQRACTAFGAFLTRHPSSVLAHEAKVKRARACLLVGSHDESPMQVLQGAAGRGPADLPRALANLTLAERGEIYLADRDYSDRRTLALEQLAAVVQGSGGRWAKEARVLFFELTFRLMEENTHNVSFSERLYERALSLKPAAAERTRATYLRARTWMRAGDKAQGERAERDLTEISQGSGEYADDALFELGQQRERTRQFTAALELYQRIQARFDGTASNVHDEAGARIQEIQRPTLALSTHYIDLPEVKPTLALAFRNVAEVSFTLRRLDPLQQSPAQLLGAEPVGTPGEVVKRWTRSLTVPAPHVPGSLEEAIEVPGPGAWMVEATAGTLQARDWLLVTPLAMVLKISPDEVTAFVANAATGEAMKNAEIVIALQHDRPENVSRIQGRTDEAGLVRLSLKSKGEVRKLIAWASVNGYLTYASGWANPYFSDEQRDWLAYVMTDRPLYKPGEMVQAKLFLRSRAEGPSIPVEAQTVHVIVYDAQSREVLKKELTTNAFGTAAFQLPLGEDVALGQWRILVEAHRSGYSGLTQAPSGFRVEEFKPPEFTVTVEPSGTPVPNETARVRITAARYSGGPVANANGRAIVTERIYRHRWSPWEDDAGEDGGGADEWESRRNRRHGGYYSPPPLRQTTLTFRTDADGVALLELPKPEGNDRSYEVQVFVTDKSRREVTGSGTLNVSSTPAFVDARTDRYLYKPGEPLKVQLRSEDANGRPQSPEVEVRLLRLHPDASTSVILGRTTRLENGRGEIVLEGDALGAARIEVRRPGSQDDEPPHASTDVWLSDDARPVIPPYEGFELLTDRVPLKAGGTLRALVVTPQAGGHVLLTLEGQAMHTARVFPLNGRARFVELPLTTVMTPNAWLYASRLEEGRFLERQAPVKVSGIDNALQVDVSHTAEVVKPGEPQQARIGVKNASGEVELAVSTVDEALFAIEPERDDLLSFFGRRRQQHRVRTLYTQAHREFRQMPVYGPAPSPEAEGTRGPPPTPVGAPLPPSAAAGERVLEQKRREIIQIITGKSERPSPAKSASAGLARAEPLSAEPLSAESSAPPVKVRTNFSSSAGWFPQVRASGSTELALQVPDSLTRFRTLAVALTAGGQMGTGRASFRTEQPLMVRLQAPRFFTERDEVTLSAVVTSRLPRSTSVQVEFSASGFEALDGTQRTVEVPAGGEARVDARYRVIEPGEAKVQVVARGGGEQDAMALTLPVVVHGAAQRATFAGRLSDEVKLQVKLPELRNASATRFELTVSPTLASVMMDALPYLAQYPYGCVEQTLSRFVPAAIAARTARELGLPKSRVPAELDAMVDAGLQRLYGFQHADGGWGWWQADPTNRWMTAYVVYGLSLGRAAGLKVDASVLERGRVYLTRHLGAALDDPEEHTWMVFALASTGSVPKAALDKAFSRRTQLSHRGRALLALALQSARDSRARIAVENLDDIIQVARGQQEASVGDADDRWQTSEAIEATAYTLMALSRHDAQGPSVRLLTDFLVTRRNGGKWRTTRDTAFALYALSEIAARERISTAAGSLVVQVNGREAARVRYSNGGMELSGPVVLTDAAFRPGDNAVVIRRDGAEVTGYYAATFDVYNRDENVKGVGGGVRVKRTYTLLGRPAAASERLSASAEYGMPVESGVRVRVDLEVKANKPVEFLLIEDLKPAGFEAVAQKSGPEICNRRCAHVELRSDRVAFFFPAIPKGVTKLSYELRAEVPGRFHALPARVEAMYAPELQATSDEMRLEVRDAPEPGKEGVAADGR